VSDPQRLLARTLLAMLFVVSALRLAGFVAQFGRESLQLDFSAFYAAGEAHRQGLSPYLTHADRQPPVWDGADAYRHSRFLYPPLVAAFFEPLTHLGYGAAKRVWMLLSLACVAGALWACGNALRLRWDALTVLGLGIWVCLFHPLLALLERGQVDAVTLLLVVLAIRPLVRDGRGGLASGFLLAIATLFKLNGVFFVPFLVWRRRWRVLAGYVLGGLVLVAATIALDGTSALRNYLTRELPRISRHGEGGSVDMRLLQETLQSLRAGAPDGQTYRDGRLYRLASLGFVANASLARVVSKRLGGGEAPARMALAILAAAVLLLGMVQWRRRDLPQTPLQAMVYWEAVMVSVLLAGPLTWAMNTVWLLPAGVLVRAAWREIRGPLAAAALAVLVLGLLLAAIPDHHAFPLLSPVEFPALHLKYVLAELLVLAGLLGLLAGLPPANTKARGTGG
jgi:hypothetical protein